jgi:hypothetical protein
MSKVASTAEIDYRRLKPTGKGEHNTMNETGLDLPSSRKTLGEIQLYNGFHLG